MSLETMDRPPTARIDFLKGRVIPLIAVVLSISILVGLSFGPNLDIEEATMAQHYRLSLVQGQILYGILSLVCFCAFIFAKQFRRLCRHPIVVRVTLLAILMSSFLVVRLTIPNVGFHLGFYPPRIWWIIFGIIALNSLLIIEVSTVSRIRYKWMIRASIAILILLGCVLLVLYVVSIGRYRNLDNSDEPWMANIATNYAQYGTMDSNYGGPQGDLFSPRYYLLMGLWLKLVGHTDLIALRAFPTLVSISALILMSFFLFRVSSFNTQQRIVGLIVMLSSLPFLWSAHNLRPEIGLAPYGVLVLITAYNYFNKPNASRWWLFFIGLSAYIGLDTIPTFTIEFAFIIGLIVIVHAFRWPLRYFQWAEVGSYLIGCIGGIALYAFIHFWPISKLDNISLFLDNYRAGNTGRSPIVLFYGLSFLNAVSPLEIVFVITLFILILWRNRTPDRWIVAIFVAAIITAIFPWTATIGYLAVLAPFIAYMGARLCRSRIITVVIAFILLPALTSMAIYDMTDYLTLDENMSFVNHAEILKDKIPEGSTIVGMDKLWYVLHTNRTFIGWPGVLVAQIQHGLSFDQAVNSYKPDFVICQDDSPEYRKLIDSGMFSPVDEARIQNQRIVVLRPVKSLM